MYKLKLFIPCETRNSVNLLKDLKVILETELMEPYSLEVIEVLDNPQKAIDEGVFATPTLIKLHPPPVKKIICDLNYKDTLLEELGLAKRQESTVVS